MPAIDTPIMLDIPEYIETERLIIRPCRRGDGPTLNAALVESKDALQPWFAWTVPLPTIAQSEEDVRKAAANFILREYLLFMIFLKQGGKDGGEFIGMISIHDIDWTVPAMELGYWLRTSAQGKGYMLEAVKRMEGYCFEHLHAERIEIQCDVRNTTSASVAERAGYTLQGRINAHERDHFGVLTDSLIYVKLRGEHRSG